ncbi:hypothetical protein NPIL_263991 [Nephila pilipes]|uniref:Uncharacterized protein n=1 Tax=Nephila pilipes TaxID=299642 RepID=A0A8X6TYR7_NEPPI|nr:hypothetical protein NPIL_263991 [Nephila pilipes]
MKHSLLNSKFSLDFRPTEKKEEKSAYSVHLPTVWVCFVNNNKKRRKNPSIVDRLEVLFADRLLCYALKDDRTFGSHSESMAIQKLGLSST